MKINGSIVGWLLEKVKRNIQEELKKPVKNGEGVNKIHERVHKAAMKVFMRHCTQEHNLVALVMEAFEAFLDEEFWPLNKKGLAALPNVEVVAQAGRPCSAPVILTILREYEDFLANGFRKQMTDKFKVEYPLSYDQI